MIKILILVGGIVHSIEDEFWKKLASTNGVTIKFAFSLWADYKLESRQWIEERTISTDVEHQSEVFDYYRSLITEGMNHPDETRPLNTLLMWHKWSRFLSVDALDDFDIIIKTRSDIDIAGNDPNTIIAAINRVSSSDRLDLAIPSGGDHRGGIHDILAIGRPLAIKHYLNIINLVLSYYDELQLFHPERILRYHLIDRGKMRVLRFPFSITLRNCAYNNDIMRWYTDCLPLSPCWLRSVYEDVKKLGLYNAIKDRVRC